ncbi:MAG: hypothetical protein K5685_07295 [Bacteroidales bacterium]|nr:hypothetical protein [Bacteroidales bacterium]
MGIKNKVQTDEVCNEKLKCYLTRLGNSDYEDELIEANYQAKVFDYHDHGVISGFNKRGRYKAIEVVGDYYKLTNLKALVDGKYLITDLPYVEKYKMENLTIDDIINPPSEDIAKWINKELDESFFPLCEDVAKWMEDNFDKLEVNPNLRF